MSRRSPDCEPTKPGWRDQPSGAPLSNVVYGHDHANPSHRKAITQDDVLYQWSRHHRRCSRHRRAVPGSGQRANSSGHGATAVANGTAGCAASHQLAPGQKTSGVPDRPLSGSSAPPGTSAHYQRSLGARPRSRVVSDAIAVLQARRTGRRRRTDVPGSELLSELIGA